MMSIMTKSWNDKILDSMSERARAKARRKGQTRAYLRVSKTRDLDYLQRLGWSVFDSTPSSYGAGQSYILEVEV